MFGAWLITRKINSDVKISRWQSFLEVLVETIRDQIEGITHRKAERYLPFIGALFLFIAVSNILMAVPGYIPPTGSLSTTTALALCVLLAVPIYGISERGVSGYLRKYLQPTIFMFPFNVIGEISRTIALAVRLYGNIMSGTVIVAILLGIAPFFFPVLINFLGLLTGFIQAYIFSILAMVYIASATQAEPSLKKEESSE